MEPIEDLSLFWFASRLGSWEGKGPFLKDPFVSESISAVARTMGLSNSG